MKMRQGLNNMNLMVARCLVETWYTVLSILEKIHKLLKDNLTF